MKKPLVLLLPVLLAAAFLATCSEPRWKEASGPSRRRTDAASEDSASEQAANAAAAAALFKSFGVDGAPRFLKRSWKQQAPGLIADLSVSESGGTVVASTIFDAERPDSSANGKQLVVWDSSGTVKSSTALVSQTRVQDVSPDGGVAWLTSHDGDLQGWDPARGRRLWTLPRACRPVGLAESIAICVRDDEPRPPEVLFEAIDSRGKVFFSLPRGDSGEVLQVKKSQGGKYFALLLSGGSVRIFKAGTFHQDGERVPFVREIGSVHAEGEPLDADFGLPADSEEESAFFVSVVSIDAQSRPLLEVFDATGRRQGGAVLDRPALQVGCSASCRNIVLYGNGLGGQWVAGASLTSLRLPVAGAVQSELSGVRWNWVRRLPRSADYASKLLVPSHAPAWKLPADGDSEDALAGFEWSDGLERRSFLVAFNSADGSVRWLVPIDSGEGAYLYAFGLFGGGAKGTQLVVATDDGWLRGFTLP